MLPVTSNGDPETARVIAAQQLLFRPLHGLCAGEMGLNWWAALKLHEDGWLSFCPESTARLDEAQEAELRFVGSLVIAGCDRPMLSALLGGLPKPYAYHASRLYYDWSGQQWRVLPDPRLDPEAVFAEWLEVLIEKAETATITGILELANDALARVHVASRQQRLYRQA